MAKHRQPIRTPPAQPTRNAHAPTAMAIRFRKGPSCGSERCAFARPVPARLHSPAMASSWCPAGTITAFGSGTRVPANNNAYCADIPPFWRASSSSPTADGSLRRATMVTFGCGTCARARRNAAFRGPIAGSLAWLYRPTAECSHPATMTALCIYGTRKPASRCTSSGSRGATSCGRWPLRPTASILRSAIVLGIALSC